jgi:integrase
MSEGRQEVAQFTAHFNEYKSRQDELAELESAYRDAVQRRAKLEASESARMPATKVLEAAATPQQPWRPLYWRDTALAIGGSLALALLAMWLVELFNRSEPRPAVVLIQPSAGALPYEASPHLLASRSRPAVSLEATEPALLPRQPTFPRELRHNEVAALIRASDDNSRLIMLLLLSGVSLEEAMKLRWSDVDLARGTIHVDDDRVRNIALNDALRRCLGRAPNVPGSDLLVGHPGRPVTRDNIDAQILCAAHDAGIEDATQITSDCLRHTYLAFLVRQGIRFADLTQLVGYLPVEIVGAYSTLSPPAARIDMTQIRLFHPALSDENV